MSPPPIRAITFDVGGTLIEPWPSVGHIYAKIAGQHGCQNLSPEMLNRRFANAWQTLHEFNYTQHDWEKLVDTVFHGLTAQLPSQTFFPELYDWFSRKDAWRLFDDVLPALDNLASLGIKLGVISNWDERLQPLLRELRLHAYFDAVLVSCEIGFCKPSTVIFEFAARKLGLRADTILHVGDGLDTDVRGAEAAGFQTRRLCRDRKTGGDGEIGALTELTALLRERVE